MNHLSPRRALRLARMLQRFSEIQKAKAPPFVDTSYLSQRGLILLCLLRQADKAAKREWHAAARQTWHDLEAADRLWRKELQETVESSQKSDDSRNHPLMPLAEIMQDIRQLETEFDRFEFYTDKFQQTLSVVTDPIILEDVPLGHFKILLQLDKAEHKLSNWFRIVALDPNPAHGGSDDNDDDDAVVHPHVQCETLCAGDATAPLSRAVADGRFYDAFVLIRTVLTTYNAHSAYVKLEDWFTSRCCSDCDNRMCESDSYNCRACGYDYCGECILGCEECAESLCGGCSVQQCRSVGCRARLNYVCHNCRVRCSNCKDSFCENCLSDCETCENKICEQCGVACVNCQNINCDACLSACADCGQSVCANCGLNAATREPRGVCCPTCHQKREEEEDEKCEEQVTPVSAATSTAPPD